MNDTVNPTSADMDAIMAKLMSLKALKDGAATPGEAAAAAAGISRLCFKFNLDAAQIGDKDENTQAPSYEKNNWQLDGKLDDSTQIWKFTLLDTLARHNFCRASYYGTGHSVILLGKPHNLELVKSLHGYLSTQVKRLTIKYWRQAFPDDHAQRNNTPEEVIWKRSFRNAVVDEIDTLLIAKQAEDVKAAGTSGNALVVNVAAELIREWDKHFGLTEEQKKQMAERKAAEEARRAALTDEQRAAEDKATVEALAKWRKTFKPGRGRKSVHDRPIDWEAVEAGQRAAAEINFDKQIAKGAANKAVK